MHQRPRRLWYLLPAAALAALVGHVVFGVMALLAAVEALPRVTMPASATIELDAGDATLFHESSSGRAGPLTATIRCSLTDAAGTDVELRPAAGSTRYSIGNRQGQSLFDVEIASAGPHVLSCEADDGRSFAIAAAPSMLEPMLAFFLVCALLLAAAIIGVAVIAYLRYRGRPLPAAVAAAAPYPAAR